MIMLLILYGISTCYHIETPPTVMAVLTPIHKVKSIGWWIVRDEHLLLNTQSSSLR